MKLLILFILSPFFLFCQIQIHTDIDGELALDNSGHSVSSSFDGSIIAIGSPSYDGVIKGLVRVFENNGDSWIQIGDDIGGEYEEDHFGHSVSLSSDGSIIAIGGPDANGPDADTAGYVRVYQNINNVWTQLGVDIKREVAGDRFGSFVSLSNNGTKLAISGYTCCGLQHGTPGVGYTRIYENINGDWVQIGEEISTGFSGVVDIALSADGSVVAIASSGGGNPGWSNFFSGGVKVYNNTSGVWEQIGDTFLREVFGWWYYDYFGGVSLTDDGSKIAIGGLTTNVFENIANEWVQLGEDIETGGFMPKVSLSDNANILAIGGPVTRLYENNSGNWTQLGIDISGEAANDNFGASLELSSDGTTLIVGASKNDGNGIDAGHARIYDLSALLSIEESNIFSVKFYPNPAKYKFTIKLNDNSELENVRIYNNLGQLVLSSKETNIETSKLASGLYAVEIETTKGKGSKKLIIQ